MDISEKILEAKNEQQPSESVDESTAAQLPVISTDVLRTARLPTLLSLSKDELAQWCEEQGHKPYRAKQIRHWLLQKRANSFDEMLELPAELRRRLAESFRLFPSEIVKRQVASDRTEKLLLRLDDGQHIETVLMREPGRNTVCISTQVGCGMGCVFCASGMHGLKRNLSVAEILQQVLLMDRVQGDDEKLTNLVVMGIGEPLANLPNLLPALEVLHGHDCLGLGVRRVTISTVGLPGKIRELAQHGKGYTLAVSLHAPNDRLRSRIVPTNSKTGIAEILAAANDYFETTGRRVTFEYILLKDLNDRPAHAKELAALLKGKKAHVNLIPMNGVDLLDYQSSTSAGAQQFWQILVNNGIVATVRKRKGEDIDAACGQLRLKTE